MKKLPVSFINSYTLSLPTSHYPLPAAANTSGDFSDRFPATLHPKPWQQNEPPPIAMSVSYSNCFPDSYLLCGEDSSEILSGDSPECSSDLDSSPPSEEESIAGFIEDERNFVPGFDYLNRFQSRSLDASAREESVAWILKVTTSPHQYLFSSSFLIGHCIAFILRYCHARRIPNRTVLKCAARNCLQKTVQANYAFQPLTAYLSVNYMDRFLNSRPLPQTNGWPLQLLSVACLSLAAKMEEPLVPSLLDLQSHLCIKKRGTFLIKFLFTKIKNMDIMIKLYFLSCRLVASYVEGAKYIFEPRTIRRMELLVLGVLDWRLRSVTPFSFLDFFACKLDSTGTFTGFLISRATQIILSNIKEASFLAYWPSCIAAAAILHAANEIPNWSLVKPEHAESWCEGLRKEKIIGCYQLMQELVIDNNRRKPPKVLPQLRVTSRPLTRSSVSSFSASSSSPSSSLSCKRRKLNNCLWVDDDKGNSQ
ncbi:Cyclin-D1-1, partial [Mucuna pruriens]